MLHLTKRCQAWIQESERGSTKTPNTPLNHPNDLDHREVDDEMHSDPLARKDTVPRKSSHQGWEPSRSTFQGRFAGTSKSGRRPQRTRLLFFFFLGGGVDGKRKPTHCGLPNLTCRRSDPMGGNEDTMHRMVHLSDSAMNPWQCDGVRAPRLVLANYKSSTSIRNRNGPTRKEPRGVSRRNTCGYIFLGGRSLVSENHKETNHFEGLNLLRFLRTP